MAQMALSVVLLVSAGLFLMNLRSAEILDKGFATENRLVAGLNPELQGYDRNRTEDFYRRLGERLRAHPGVRSVGFIDQLPLSLSSSDRTISVPGYEPRPDEGMSIHFSRVSPDYFATMGIGITRGRAFAAIESAESPPVIIVNQRFADRFWPGRNPLGRAVRIGHQTPRDFLVVGVVPTGKYQSLGEAPREFMFLPQLQDWWGSSPRSVRHDFSEVSSTAPREDRSSSLRCLGSFSRFPPWQAGCRPYGRRASIRSPPCARASGFEVGQPATAGLRA